MQCVHLRSCAHWQGFLGQHLQNIRSCWFRSRFPWRRVAFEFRRVCCCNKRTCTQQQNFGLGVGRGVRSSEAPSGLIVVGGAPHAIGVHVRSWATRVGKIPVCVMNAGGGPVSCHCAWRCMTSRARTSRTSRRLRACLPSASSTYWSASAKRRLRRRLRSCAAAALSSTAKCADVPAARCHLRSPSNPAPDAPELLECPFCEDRALANRIAVRATRRTYATVWRYVTSGWSSKLRMGPFEHPDFPAVAPGREARRATKAETVGH